ncbi:hypothetical protein GW17_00024816 [Ensete ventricosum]|nr:hypothetical protein GW17_00024816 [Ensete ventricosum]
MTEVLLQSGLAKVKSMHRVDAIGNSPGVRQKLTRVSGVCQDDARVFAKRRPKLIERLSGIAEKLTESWDSSDNVVGSHRKFARRFAEGIGKLARNAKGDCREED